MHQDTITMPVTLSAIEPSLALREFTDPARSVTPTMSDHWCWDPSESS